MRSVGWHLSFLFGGIGSGTVITGMGKVSDLMKATINGIAVEGTPLEIMEFQRLQNEKLGIKSFQPLNPTNVDYQWFLKPQVTSIGSGATVSKCPNQGMPCYCTGACKI